MSITTFSFVNGVVNTQEILSHFQENGFVILEEALTPDEIKYYVDLFDQDRQKWGDLAVLWHPFGEYQTRNCHALVSSPEFDKLLRHENILPVIEFLMGGKTCFSELCLRHMTPYNGEPNQSFHRDRPHWEEHPLRMDYIQLMVYLTNVNQETHCFSISPESVNAPILDTVNQLDRNGIVDCHGVAGTVVLFNNAVLHTATVRVTKHERKTVQAYYGHRSRPFLSNCSIIPPKFCYYHPDQETRDFYGNLNDTTRMFLSAFKSEQDESKIFESVYA